MEVLSPGKTTPTIGAPPLLLKPRAEVLFVALLPKPLSPPLCAPGVEAPPKPDPELPPKPDPPPKPAEPPLLPPNPEPDAPFSPEPEPLAFPPEPEPLLNPVRPVTELLPFAPEPEPSLGGSGAYRPGVPPLSGPGLPEPAAEAPEPKPEAPELLPRPAPPLEAPKPEPPPNPELDPNPEPLLEPALLPIPEPPPNPELWPLKPELPCAAAAAEVAPAMELAPPAPASGCPKNPSGRTCASPKWISFQSSLPVIGSVYLRRR